MKKLTLGLVLGTLLVAAACGETDAPSTEAPVAETQAPAEAPAAAKASERLQGEWSIVLSDEEKRQVEILQLALKEPAPTQEDMEKMSLTEDEKMMVALMGAAKAQDPSDPKIAEMKAAADGLATATVTITASEMVFKAGPVSEKSTYTVQAETESSVTIKAVGEAEPVAEGQPPVTPEEDVAVITFTDADTIEMVDQADPTQSQRFTRKK